MKTIPKKRKYKKATLLSHEALQIAEKEREPKGLLCPWDFPGKNTGVGYCQISGLQASFPFPVKPAIVDPSSSHITYCCLTLVFSSFRDSFD